MTKPQFHRLLAIAACVGILTAALCLMGGCAYLFFSHDGYSPETVAEVFRFLSPPVYLGLGLAALGTALDAFQPRKRKRLSASRQDWLILKRLQKALELSSCHESLRREILQERRRRQGRNIILLVPAALTSAVFSWYLLSGDRFSREDVNGAVLGCVAALLPGLLLCLGWALAVLRKNAESCRREIGLLKQAGPAEKAAAESKPFQLGRYLRYSILALAVFLLVWGLYLGSAADVLTKAINICTECIGLG